MSQPAINFKQVNAGWGMKMYASLFLFHSSSFHVEFVFTYSIAWCSEKSNLK